MKVISKANFDLLWADSLEETTEPYPEELRVLWEEVNPQGVIVGRAV